MKRLQITLVTVLVTSVIASTVLFAQINAVVGGTVADASGALIPGVEVSARNVATGIVTARITNESGNYDFASLQPGSYTVSASLSGFQTATYNNVQLSQGQQVRLNFLLQVGTVAQAVEVVAEANTLLATTSSSVGDVLPEVQVRSLPLASRNVLDLVRTAATGAVGDNFAGARMSQMNTTRDGLPTMDGRYNDWNGAYSAGFSWSVPRFKRSTVIRGGYGINYAGAPAYQQYGREIGAQPGSQIQVIYTPSTYLDIAGATPSLVPLSTGGAKPNDPVPLTNRTTTLSGFTDNRVIQYSQNINFSVQRELVKDLTLELTYVGNKGTKLWNPIELNEPNIFENGILDAFNVTRAGGNAPLFDRILNGLNVTGVGVVNGTTLTGSQALRRFTTTNQWIANGDVANFANWLNSTSALTGVNGGLLKNGKLPENFIVVNPQFGSAALHGNNDNSIYHAFQAEVKKRLSRGFAGQFSYTWAKDLGNSAAANGSGSSSTATTRDPRNRQLQRGLITFDRAHQFKGNGTWDLPFGPNRAFLSNAPAWIQRTVEGWEVSGIFSWLAGAPLTLTSPIKTLGIRANVNTADFVGAFPADLGKVEVGNGFVQYFSNLKTQAAPQPNFGGDSTLPGRFTNQVVVDQSGNVILQNPQPGTTGNTAVNLPGVKGPGTLGLDMALSKKVRITEKTMFTLRADAINILNKPQWGLPNTNINSTTFGRITTATGSRTVLLNARVDF